MLAGGQWQYLLVFISMTVRTATRYREEEGVEDRADFAPFLFYTQSVLANCGLELTICQVPPAQYIRIGQTAEGWLTHAVRWLYSRRHSLNRESAASNAANPPFVTH